MGFPPEKDPPEHSGGAVGLIHHSGGRQQLGRRPLHGLIVPIDARADALLPNLFGTAQALPSGWLRPLLVGAIGDHLPHQEIYNLFDGLRNTLQNL